MTKRKIRKGKQLSLTNPKNAGRPAIHDKGIRHRKREEIERPRSLHLTIKLNRAQMQNKMILKHLKHSIKRGRLKGLRIIHFSLQNDHVHLYAESESNLILTQGMKALGVSFAKRVNKYFKTKGQVYKTRFHLRVLRSASEAKNVINYILKNGFKHNRTKSFIDPYSSWVALHDFKLIGLGRKKEREDIGAYIFKHFHREYFEFKDMLDCLRIYERELRFMSKLST
jgi:REP element-mobilizing transposase RayT